MEARPNADAVRTLKQVLRVQRKCLDQMCSVHRDRHRRDVHFRRILAIA